MKTKADVVLAMQVLKGLQAAYGELLEEQTKAKQAVIPVELQETLDRVDGLYKPRMTDLKTRIFDMEKAIKEGTLEVRKSISGDGVSAKYFKGRVSWDGDKLDGYAAGHPEILPFRKVGAAYVTLTIK